MTLEPGYNDIVLCDALSIASKYPVVLSNSSLSTCFSELVTSIYKFRIIVE
jgi:hypothetical protein